MNIAYGALALIISFVVSKIFEKYRAPKIKIFIFAFVAEFVLILLLGGVFYLLGLGFFSWGHDDHVLVFKVIGFAAFLSVLVGVKAVNQNVTSKR